jgi:hypothetical protein
MWSRHRGCGLRLDASGFTADMGSRGFRVGRQSYRLKSPCRFAQSGSKICNTKRILQCKVKQSGRAADTYKYIFLHNHFGYVDKMNHRILNLHLPTAHFLFARGKRRRKVAPFIFSPIEFSLQCKRGKDGTSHCKSRLQLPCPGNHPSRRCRTRFFTMLGCGICRQCRGVTGEQGRGERRSQWWLLPRSRAHQRSGHSFWCFTVVGWLAPIGLVRNAFAACCKCLSKLMNLDGWLTNG